MRTCGRERAASTAKAKSGTRALSFLHDNIRKFLWSVRLTAPIAIGIYDRQSDVPSSPTNSRVDLLFPIPRVHRQTHTSKYKHYRSPPAES